MSTLGYNSSLGMRTSAPNVPAKSTNSLTDNQGSPTYQVAVLHQVAPDNNNPSMASVLIQNRFPPVPGFSLPSGFGPVYVSGAVGAPANGPFVNNPTTMEGGSFVTVDTVTNTVISLRQGVSTQFPSSATTQIANHVHTGATDPSTGYPMPEQVDLVSHVAGQLTKPNYAEMPILTTANVTSVTAVEDHGGFPAYNVTLTFTLDHAGTKASPWLNVIQVVAIPVGLPQNTVMGSGKVLVDVMTALTPGTNYLGSPVGGTGAVYQCYVGGMTAGIKYNIYAVYLDYNGNSSLYGPSTTALIYTSSGEDITVTNLPGLGIIPTIYQAASPAYSAQSQTTFDVNVQYEIHYAGTNATNWLQEIRLYATLWDTTQNGGAGGPYVFGGGSTASPALVNIIGPDVTNNVTITYLSTWPGLALSSGTQPNMCYRLSLTFIAENGDESAQVPVYVTSSQNMTVYRPAMATISPTYTPVVATAGGPDYPFDGNPVYDCEFQFTADVAGTSENPALNFIQLVAYPVGTDISASNNFGKVLYDVISPLQSGFTYYDPVGGPGTNGTNGALYHAYVGGLSGGTSYTIAAIYTDFAGNRSVPGVIVAATGTHPVTNNNLPGPGSPPSNSLVVTGSSPSIAYSIAQGTSNTSFNAIAAFNVNYTGTTCSTWLQEIELYATLWNNSTNKPYLYSDGVTYATPILVNVISAADPSTGLVPSTGAFEYIGEFPNLAALYPTSTEAVYNLGIRFVAKNGQRSAFTGNGGIYGSQSAGDLTSYLGTTDPVRSAATVTRPVLAQMPSTYQPGLPTAAVSLPTVSLNKNQATITITWTPADSDGYNGNPWLDKIRVLALNVYYDLGLYTYFPGDGGSNTQLYNAATVDGTHGTVPITINNANIYQITQAYLDITPQESGQYMTTFTLPTGNFYQFMVVYLDHSGRGSCPVKFDTTSISGPGVSSDGIYCGWFCTFSSGVPSSLYSPTIGTATIYAYKPGTTWNAIVTIATDSPSFPNYIEYVDFWLVELSGGVETGGVLQKQRLGVIDSGVYIPSFSNLTASTSYHMYVQYIAYGAKVNPWPSAAVYFASNEAILTLTTAA